jgi:hypothetical protein
MLGVSGRDLGIDPFLVLVLAGGIGRGLSAKSMVLTDRLPLDGCEAT